MKTIAFAILLAALAVSGAAFAAFPYPSAQCGPSYWFPSEYRCGINGMGEHLVAVTQDNVPVVLEFEPDGTQDFDHPYVEGVSTGVIPYGANITERIKVIYRSTGQSGAPQPDNLDGTEISLETKCYAISGNKVRKLAQDFLFRINAGVLDPVSDKPPLVSGGSPALAGIKADVVVDGPTLKLKLIGLPSADVKWACRGVLEIFIFPGSG